MKTLFVAVVAVPAILFVYAIGALGFVLEMAFD